MLHVYAGGDNAAPTVHDVHSDANVPTRSAGLPDDLAAFLESVYAEEEPMTEAEIDALCEAEARRTAGASMAFDLRPMLSAAVAAVYPGLASPLPPAA